MEWEKANSATLNWGLPYEDAHLKAVPHSRSQLGVLLSICEAWYTGYSTKLELHTYFVKGTCGCDCTSDFRLANVMRPSCWFQFLLEMHTEVPLRNERDNAGVSLPGHCRDAMQTPVVLHERQC